MSPRDLEKWMRGLGLNQTGAAASLGIARSTLDRYLDGSSEIPLAVALACQAVWKGFPPFPETKPGDPTF